VPYLPRSKTCSGRIVVGAEAVADNCGRSRPDYIPVRARSAQEELILFADYAAASEAIITLTSKDNCIASTPKLVLFARTDYFNEIKLG